MRRFRDQQLSGEGKLDQIAAGVNLRVIRDAQISLCDIFGKI
jgi:hypothetical protein